MRFVLHEKLLEPVQYASLFLQNSGQYAGMLNSVAISDLGQPLFSKAGFNEF